MGVHRSWYREKVQLTIENAPESMLRKLLLFAEVLRNRLRGSGPDTRRIAAPAVGALPPASLGIPPLDA